VLSPRGKSRFFHAREGGHGALGGGDTTLSSKRDTGKGFSSFEDVEEEDGRLHYNRVMGGSSRGKGEPPSSERRRASKGNLPMLKGKG